MNIQKLIAALLLTAIAVSLVFAGVLFKSKSEQTFLSDGSCVPDFQPCYTKANSPYDKDTPCCEGSVCNKNLLFPSCVKNFGPF